MGSFLLLVQEVLINQPCRLTTILEFPMLIVAFAIPLKKRYNNKLVYWQILL